MMDPSQLDKVAVVAKADESKAATVHQQRQQVAQQSQQRLGQLEQFRQEYETRLSALSQSGMDARQLADYRRFLSGLSDAITRQGDELQRDRANMIASQNDLREQSQRRMTVDELIAQTRAGLLREEERREQKLSDETSLQRHSLGPAGQ